MSFLILKFQNQLFQQPKEQLDAKKILEISNAEQRMQAMKLKGLGAFFNQLESKSLDKRDGYELLLVNHVNEWREYLKMKIPWLHILIALAAIAFVVVGTWLCRNLPMDW